jgi:hypothetical protein
LSILIKELNSAPSDVAGVEGIRIPPEVESFFERLWLVYKQVF